MRYHLYTSGHVTGGIPGVHCPRRCPERQSSCEGFAATMLPLFVDSTVGKGVLTKVYGKGVRQRCTIGRRYTRGWPIGKRRGEGL